MTTEETAVVEALGTFKRQADDCVTCLYAYLTIHAIAGQSRSIRMHINENALFWNTTLHALQTALILALGRVFETNTPHNVGTFMRVMHLNRSAFSRSALRTRKQPIFSNSPGELATYVREARIPYPSDFRRVAGFVRRHRAAYIETYRSLRDKVFAHTLTVDQEEIARLFSKTNIRQLQRMTTYLNELHDAFWEAFHNGGRLTVRRRRISINRILRLARVGELTAATQEATVAQTREALQPWEADPVRRLRRRR